MEEAPAVKEEPQDSESAVTCMSANSVAVEVEDSLHFVELKSELEVCSWTVDICNFHLSIMRINLFFELLKREWNKDISESSLTSHILSVVICVKLKLHTDFSL